MKEKAFVVWVRATLKASELSSRGWLQKLSEKSTIFAGQKIEVAWKLASLAGAL